MTGVLRRLIFFVCLAPAAFLPAGALDALVQLAWLGGGAEGTWAQALQPLLVLVAWTALALLLAQRSMRWEPRA